jgi:hypothetical protein
MNWSGGSTTGTTLYLLRDTFRQLLKAETLEYKKLVA